MAVLISWVPLALMAAVRVFILREDEGRSFPSDVGVHARFLVAAPALILAEPDCLRRLERVVRHFCDSGLVTNTDRLRYDAAVTSSYKLLHSAVAEILIVVLAYALVAAFALNIMPSRFPLWRFSSVSGSYHLSPAGWWHVLVSVPLLNVLFLGWVWRLLLMDAVPVAHDAARPTPYFVSSRRGGRAEVCQHFATGVPADRVCARINRGWHGCRPSYPSGYLTA